MRKSCLREKAAFFIFVLTIRLGVFFPRAGTGAEINYHIIIISLKVPLRHSVRGCCRVMEIFEPQN